MDITSDLSSMKTILDIPERLLAYAMKATGAATKRDAVMRALEEFNRRDLLRKLTERLGSSDTFVSPDELSKLRRRNLQRTAKNRRR